MYSIICIIYLCLSNAQQINSSEKISYKIKSFINYNWKVFDIKDLMKIDNDYEINKKNSSFKIYLNIANNNHKGCKNESGQVSLYYNGTDCMTLSGDIKYFNNWTITNNGSDSKIQIIMNDGTKCRFNNSENYSITLNLQCNNSQDSLFFDDSIDDFDMSKCNYILNATTKHACPISNEYVYDNFLSDYNYIFGLKYFIFGILILLFGLRFILFTFFFFGIIFTSKFIDLIVELIGTSAIQVNYFWIIIAVEIILGILLSILMKKYVKICVLLLGIYSGIIFNQFLYQLLIIRISQTKLCYGISIIIFIIIGLLFSYFFYRILMLVSTSYTGSYLIITGVSLYAQILPNNKYLRTLYEREEYSQLKIVLGWPYYIAIIFLGLIFLLGLIIQFEVNKRKPQQMQTENIHEIFYDKLFSKVNK